MPTDLLLKVALTVLGTALAGYLAFNLYSQPRADYRRIEPIRAFLRHALAGDSTALVAEADAQPIRWVRMAIRLDSVAVHEWAESRPKVTSVERRDTLWVTLRRSGSSAHCSPLYPLTAKFLQDRDDLRLIHLSSSCPSIPRAVGR